MKNTNTYSGNFAAVKFQTNSKANGRMLLAVTIVTVVGLLMTACSNGSTELPDPNLFLGEWEGFIISSTYASYGEIPIDLTITEEGWVFEVMGQSAEGTYTRNGKVLTILYYDEPMGTGTINADGELVILIEDEAFGTVTGTLRPKTSKPSVENLFLGEWEGTVTASNYAEYGEIPVALTITEDGLLLSVMGQEADAEYTLNGNVLTILFYGEPVGTGTLNAAGKIEVNIVDESFGAITGTLTRKASAQFGTPVVGDYNITGSMTQTAGSVTAITVTRKDNTKSPGLVTVYYTGTGGTGYAKSQTVPQTAGSYTVTFDVAAAAAAGWNAAEGLPAGTLTVYSGDIQPPAEPTIAVTVVFANTEDAEITINDFVLGEGDELAVTVAEIFATYAWYINGVPAGNALVSNGGKTVTLRGDGNYLNVGNNRLSVRVTDNDGVVYSKSAIFTVESN